MKTAGKGIPRPKGPKVGGNPQKYPGKPKAAGRTVGQRKQHVTKGNVK